MPRRLLVVVVGMLTLLLAAATTATAADVQTANQAATSAQGATASSSATQVAPSNTNISVRVLSPGDNGSVTQTNAVGSLAAAANGNSTTQSAGQTQLGTGGTGIQTSDQSASNTQLAGALSTASQFGASNVNLPIRVGSLGSNGSVTQTNAVGSAAGATNTNGTTQGSGQLQAGSAPCGCAGGTGVQTSDQSASSTQQAAAQSAATQIAPKNVNLDIRVGSPGSSGAVNQTNATGSTAAATNANGTAQTSGQSQIGAGGGTGIQTSDQTAANTQSAGAGSSATQVEPKNVNLSVRVLSPGDNGSVSQTNAVGSTAVAANDNRTGQLSTQSQLGTGGCGCAAGTGIQTSKQTAASAQGALALSSASQVGASNVNMPIRVGSPGNDGSVSQTNAVLSAAIADNRNATAQTSGQSQVGGGGIGVQTIDQTALNFQGATAGSAAFQFGASNTNAPIRVGSPGGGGSVTQANIAGSTAIASNTNGTSQFGAQSQVAAPGCGCIGGIGIQALGQHAFNDQGATAQSTAVQDFPKAPCGCAAGGNSNGPIRVGSFGDDGSVTQVNAVGSLAAATNLNGTSQTGGQGQLGGAGIGIQALGQQALSGQGATALSGALQAGASNGNSPLRVLSFGSDGSVTQVNAVGSAAFATNANGTFQFGAQSQFGLSPCGCGAIGIQALGQTALNRQLGTAISAAAQLAPSNSNKPTSVWSFGGGGSVFQLNAANSLAAALNRNLTQQLASQFQL